MHYGAAGKEIAYIE